MAINYDTFVEVVSTLYENRKKQKRYLDDLRKIEGGSGICEFVFENTYIELESKSNDLLMKAFFGNLVDDVYWFLYDWEKGFTITVNNRQFVINSIDDYFKYADEVYFTTSGG